MGDMADYWVSECVDSYWDDDADLEDDSPLKYQPSCKYCGSYDVEWHCTFTGKVPMANIWRLYDTKTNKPHTCKQYYDRHSTPSRTSGVRTPRDNSRHNPPSLR